MKIATIILKFAGDVVPHTYICMYNAFHYSMLFAVIPIQRLLKYLFQRKFYHFINQDFVTVMISRIVCDWHLDFDRGQRTMMFDLTLLEFSTTFYNIFNLYFGIATIYLYNFSSCSYDCKLNMYVYS